MRPPLVFCQRADFPSHTADCDDDVTRMLHSHWMPLEAPGKGTVLTVGETDMRTRHAHALCCLAVSHSIHCSLFSDTCIDNPFLISSKLRSKPIQCWASEFIRIGLGEHVRWRDQTQCTVPHEAADYDLSGGTLPSSHMCPHTCSVVRTWLIQ